MWFDLTGLRILLDAAARAGRAGARVTITNSQPTVPGMLALLNLRDALDTQATITSRSCATPDSAG